MRRFTQDLQAVNRHFAAAYDNELFHSSVTYLSAGEERVSFAPINTLQPAPRQSRRPQVKWPRFASFILSRE
jgi:hypothetical protein